LARVSKRSPYLLTPSFAQTSDDPLDEAKPAPASVGADIPLTYFGPPPSEVQRELIGPYKLLKAGQVDEDAGTVTLPLYQGRMKDVVKSGLSSQIQMTNSTLNSLVSTGLLN